LLSLIVLVILSTCSKPEPIGPINVGKGPQPIARTVLTSRLRNDFDYPLLQAGEPGSIQIHLTDLLDGSPLEAAEVRVAIRRRGAGEAVAQSVAKVGDEKGNYLAVLTVAQAGDYDIEFRVKNLELDERFPLSDFKVE
jgi:hypothetical protein